jgi:long-chain fatty acid transport protein
MKLNKIAALLAVAGLSSSAFATNGMNMEGYGPVATAMGGASMAYDNGTAGLINNPATLGFMKSGTARFDIAIGGLHPDVTTKRDGMPDANSDGTAYYMPAVGYVRKDGKLTYGLGMMAQGGMGTEYGSNTFLSGNPGIPTMTGGMAGPTGQTNRSELGIGRLIFPLAYDVSDNFNVGGSLDYLWGGLDIQMVMSGQMFGAFTQGTSPLGSASGTMVDTLGAFVTGGQITDVNWAQFDFSQGGNKMKQRLKTDGWAGNLGFTWKAAPNLTIGGVYHAKTRLGDMEGNGTLRMQAVTAAPFPAGTQTIPITGKLKVVDFQWPETYGLGLAYQVNDKLMLAADYKRIGWAHVMQNFRMSFSADATQADALAQGMVTAGATNMDATLFQNWKNQNVFMIGGAYKYTSALTLRAGLNLANNPVPDSLMNPLFPATIKNHVTFGFGYAFSPAASIDFSLTHAPSVSATNNNMGVTTTHSQKNNWQLMYSNRF